MKHRSKFSLSTHDLTLSAMFCALTAVLSQIAIPIEPVPFSFGIMGVLLTTAVLNMKCAVLAQLTYLLLGCVGVPVFAQFSSGLSALIGPTGGYLFSYLLIALFCGFLLEYVFRRRGLVEMLAVLLLGLLLCYLCGTAWLAHLLNLPFRQALGMGVLPFVFFDLIKASFSAMLGVRVRRTLLRANLM